VEVTDLVQLAEKASGIISIVGVDRARGGARGGGRWCSAGGAGSLAGHGWLCTDGKISSVNMKIYEKGNPLTLGDGVEHGC
jgi:hypothetical protein